MPRPRKRRCISSAFPAAFYKPQGVPLGQLRGVTLRMEGLEAMRLVDAEGLSQEEAALRMEVSRSTLCRILGEARTVVARALASGWAIRIEEAYEVEVGKERTSTAKSIKRLGCLGRDGVRPCDQHQKDG